MTGVVAGEAVAVVSVEWHGSDALTLVYRMANGRVADEILYRHDEVRLEIVEAGRPWSFDGDGALFRLVAEAHRIRLAHLFDPVLAVHTSLVDALPHQITAMLPRQPLPRVGTPQATVLDRAKHGVGAACHACRYDGVEANRERDMLKSNHRSL